MANETTFAAGRGSQERPSFTFFDRTRSGLFLEDDAIAVTLNGEVVGRFTNAGISTETATADFGYINPYNYALARTDVTLQLALDAIGVSNVALLLMPGAWSIANDLTIPENVILSRCPGASLNIDSGVTVTVNGPMVGPLTSWITGEGSVTFGNYIAELHPEWWGALSDGSTDSTEALQASFTVGAFQDKTVRLSSGVYVITDTLWVTSTDSSTFRTGRIVGSGRGYGSGVSQTIIDATAILEKPALNIRRGRGVYIGHFTIIGPNTAPSLLAHADKFYDADWVTQDVRDSRYSPQCAIAIDAGMGPTPPDGGYDGFTYINTAGGTADVCIDNIGIRSCVVGVMHNPESSVATQGDTITLYHPQIQDCKVAIAVGQSQARAFSIYGGSMQDCRELLNTSEYGQQQGSIVQCYGTQLFGAFQVFSHVPGFSGMTLNGVRAESIHRIGNIGVGTSTLAQPSVFVNCDFNILNSGAPVVLESASAPVIFIGGNISPHTSGRDSCFIVSPQTVFQGTQFDNFTDDARPYIGDPNDLANPCSLQDVRVVQSSTSVLYGTSGRIRTLPTRVQEHWGTQGFRLTGVTPHLYVPGLDNGYISASTTSNFVWSDTELTFTCTTVTHLLVGDVLMWLMLAVGASTTARRVPALKVTAISGTDVTCSLLWLRRYYNEADAPTSLRILVHEWAPGAALTGDITSGSPTIANVSPTTILQNGDWIKGASGIPSNTRVVSGGGTATVTLSKNATANVTGVALFFGRMHTVDVTAAF